MSLTSRTVSCRDCHFYYTVVVSWSVSSLLTNHNTPRINQTAPISLIMLY